MGYYWPSMNKEAVVIWKKCKKCLLSIDKEESYCICCKRLESSIHGVLGSRILPTDRTLTHQLKKLVVRYFL